MSNNKSTNSYTMSQLKKRIKAYFTEQECQYNMSVYPACLITTLITVLETFVDDVIPNVKKNTLGLYTIEKSDIMNLINENSDKYSFVFSSLKKFDSNMKYYDMLFFDINKELKNLEENKGKKLHVDNNASNFLAYILSCLQFSLLKYAISLNEYASRKTLTKKTLVSSLPLILHKEISAKLELALDSDATVNTTVESSDTIELKDATDEQQDEEEEEE